MDRTVISEETVSRRTLNRPYLKVENLLNGNDIAFYTLKTDINHDVTEDTARRGHRRAEHVITIDEPADLV